MPEAPIPRARPHPWRRIDAALPAVAAPSRVRYANLHTISNFTFLTGASHPEELVEEAAKLGHEAIAITDHHSLAGIVRAHVAAKAVGLPLLVGTRVELGLDPSREDAKLSALLYATSRRGYGNLCCLLTRGKRRAEKGACRLVLHDLLEHEADLLVVVRPAPQPDQRWLEAVRGLRDVFTDDRLSLAMSMGYDADDRGRLTRIARLAEMTRVPLVATNDVEYHDPSRRPLHDVVACIRHGMTLETAGFRLAANAERHLKTPGTMARLFAEYPDAVDRTRIIAERATAFSLDEIRYEYPHEVCPPGRTPMMHLKALTEDGARVRYPGGVPDAVRTRIEHEFTLIDELSYAPYFLTVHDLVRFARHRDILCQGRGAAANSAVCYCLGVTAVDPDRIDLLFERFISRERDEPPDIDIDFEHERREEVIQYIYAKYGRDRAALTAEVITYRGRSAIREVGKALGFSLDAVDRLAKNIDWWSNGVGDPRQLRELGMNPADPNLQHAIRLANEILGFPRHLSQHVGGFVITESPLEALVPIENAAMPDRTVIEWDKDDIDAMGMLKVDVLGLGMLTCIRKGLEMVNGIRARRAEPAIAFHQVPAEDPHVYDMICAADTVGVFQIESRAQMSMLPRLKPRCFYDLVIEVAIVRPGPIQGDMVHPYLRRRNGEEPVSYPSDAVRKVLAKTLGVPLFQEQAMALAIVAAGFTPGEADQLRRAMAAWKRKGDQIARFGERLVKGMVERGYDRTFAEKCFAQIKGFSEYGFPESHAASFALLVYVSAWIKHHHPAAFAAALLNSQPMGFYAPAQIVRDAQDHGVEVRPVDVNTSDWDCTLEYDGTATPTLRLGLRLVKGLKEEDGRMVAAAVEAEGPFEALETLRRASGARVTALRRLAAADAYTSMGLTRQQALWTLRGLRDEAPLPMFDSLVPSPDAETVPAALPPVSRPRQVIEDYAATRLSLKAHPIQFVRDELTQRGAQPAHVLRNGETWPTGCPIAVAGLVLVRQRPATASGIVFMTLEDETGIANLIVRPHIYKRFRKIARHGVAVLARGTVERQGDVVHVLTKSFETLDESMLDLTARSRDFR